jgi:ABC-type multidrug transport system fused ATPase/permease subunit
VLVLSDNGIVEHGRPEDLRERGGKFAELFA